MQLLDLQHASQGNTYLSSLIQDLPQDCFFNKVLCGCGGTHLSLINDVPYVILVPTTSLIESKQPIYPENEEYMVEFRKKYPHEIMYVYGEDIKINDITEYINKGGKKIISTYHSLKKVLKAFNNCFKYTPKDYQLLVDEAHMLTEGDDKDFMHDEINYILQSYTQFKSVCFMTATPFPLECFPEQIKHLPYLKADWNKDVLTTSVIKAQQITSRFNDYITKIAVDHLTNVKEGNAYFFYNSVEAISQIVYKVIKAEYCNVEDVRIICADKNNNYLKKYVHKDIEIETVTTAPKKLNFVTARSFEGTDIMDENGITYVCADAKKRHTRLEIHTKIPQIVNRIRNSRYNEEIYLLYTKSFISTNKSKQAYIKETEEQIKETGLLLQDYYNSSERLKAAINLDIFESSEYMTKDLNGTYIVNQNAGKRALALWESANQTYTVFKNNKSIEEVKIRTPLIELMFNGGNTTEFVLPSGLEKIKLGGKKANFTKMCKDYLTALEKKDKDTILFIEEYDDLFKTARLQFKGNIFNDFSACSYQRKPLEQRLNIQTACNDDKVQQLVISKFRIGQVYSKTKIKKVFEDIYSSASINKTVKATDIKKYFDVKTTTNSKAESCFKILSKINQ